MKNRGKKIFCYVEEASRATTESTLFAIRKDEWNTKESTVFAMHNTVRCSNSATIFLIFAPFRDLPCIFPKILPGASLHSKQLSCKKCVTLK